MIVGGPPGMLSNRSFTGLSPKRSARNPHLTAVGNLSMFQVLLCAHLRGGATRERTFLGFFVCVCVAVCFTFYHGEITLWNHHLGVSLCSGHLNQIKVFSGRNKAQESCKNSNMLQCLAVLVPRDVNRMWATNAHMINVWYMVHGGKYTIHGSCGQYMDPYTLKNVYGERTHAHFRPSGLRPMGGRYGLPNREYVWKVTFPYALNVWNIWLHECLKFMQYLCIPYIRQITGFDSTLMMHSVDPKNPMKNRGFNFKPSRYWLLTRNNEGNAGSHTSETHINPLRAFLSVVLWSGCLGCAATFGGGLSLT